jgi:hypothetical protein
MILGSYRPAAGQDQVLQEADRGGGGDRSPQPGQVSSGRHHNLGANQMKTLKFLVNFVEKSVF